MKNLTLLKPTSDLIPLKNEFIAFAVETKSDKVHLGNYELMKTNFEAYIKAEENYSKGIGLQKGWVPHTRFWYLLNGNKVIGSIDLRHTLTPSLEEFGGHIGYVIRPSERNKGYATSMLASVIPEAQKLDIQRLLLTTASDNIASQKVIKNNGGIFTAEKYSNIAGRMTAYYWIDLI